MNENIIVGRNPVREAIKSKKNIECIFISNKNLYGNIHEILAEARENKIIIKKVDKKKLDALSNGSAHQGIVAAVSSVEYSEISDMLDAAKNKNQDPFILLLDGIEDPHNLGAIIRSAECMGVHGIVAPKRHSAAINSTVQKTSAGAINHIKLAKVGSVQNAIDNLKKMGFWIYCADSSGNPCFKQDFSGKTAVIIGSEGKGASRLSKEKSDFLISIPMVGKVTSLNASVAAGIVIYEVMHKKMERAGI